jgi:hypothetical protein
MDNIAYPVDRLVTALKANRETHAADFAKALKDWRELVIKEMTANLKAAEAGEEPVLIIRLNKPENRTDDYNRVLRMLDMTSAKEVVLTEHEFIQYVMDEWAWTKSFKSLTSSYSVQNSR